ncbi:hypothetical protein HMPREF1548_06177 [Clostridium sp. KLE 1755]|nr:hypothetical protein HMPREF1548_06177 [Clostridium sp. KLE 1755]
MSADISISNLYWGTILNCMKRMLYSNLSSPGAIYRKYLKNQKKKSFYTKNYN